MPSAIRARRPSASSSVRSSWTVGDGLLAGQASGRRAGGDDHAVAVRHRRAVGELDRRGRSASSPAAGTPRRTSSPSVGVLVGLAQGDAVGLPVAGEQLLGQRRAVVGQVRLGADQRDRAGVAVGAQRLAGPQPGERGPDHDDPGVTANLARAVDHATSLRSATGPTAASARQRTAGRRFATHGWPARVPPPIPYALGSGGAVRPGRARRRFSTFATLGRIELMTLTSELSIRFLRPCIGDVLWAGATVHAAGRRNIVATILVWTDDNTEHPSAVAQGTYALPAD